MYVCLLSLDLYGMLRVNFKVRPNYTIAEFLNIFIRDSHGGLDVAVGILLSFYPFNDIGIV